MNISEFVNKNVYANANDLVDIILTGDYGDNEYYSLFVIADYESAVKDEGWERCEEGWVTSDGAGFSYADTARDLAREYDIEPYERQALEFYIVSEFLYSELLKTKNEPVCETGGVYFWGRTTSGQLIEQDGVMRRIWEETAVNNAS